MAGEPTYDAPFDAAASNSTTKPKGFSDPPPLQSVWRTDWQWVALAWLGGIFIGGIFLILALTLEDVREPVAVAAGGICLMIAPGGFATWQTWRLHHKSIGKR